MKYCTVLWFPYFERVPGNLKMKNWNEFLKMTTAHYCSLMYCTILYCTKLYYTVLYCTVLYCTVPYSYFSFWYTPLNQALCLVIQTKSFLVVVVVGDIAIIALSSRSSSDFERDLEVEILIDFEIDFRPGPELDNSVQYKNILLLNWKNIVQFTWSESFWLKDAKM